MTPADYLCVFCQPRVTKAFCWAAWGEQEYPSCACCAAKSNRRPGCPKHVLKDLTRATLEQGGDDMQEAA